MRTGAPRPPRSGHNPSGMSGVGISEEPIDAASPAASERAADRFRPDLEGLRAVAVLLVLLFHAGVSAVGGGYVGVDVFFVLSGFLITGLIVRELRSSGTISLRSFYARRARRLLPAALAAIAVTMVASALFLPPLRIPDIAGDAAASALYVSNIRFAAQATDYLQAQAAPSPLLTTGRWAWRSSSTCSGRPCCSWPRAFDGRRSAGSRS